MKVHALINALIVLTMASPSAPTQHTPAGWRRTAQHTVDSVDQWVAEVEECTTQAEPELEALEGWPGAPEGWLGVPEEWQEAPEGWLGVPEGWQGAPEEELWQEHPLVCVVCLWLDVHKENYFAVEKQTRRPHHMKDIYIFIYCWNDVKFCRMCIQEPGLSTGSDMEGWMYIQMHMCRR
jgi:hypothetical protein